MVEVLEKKGIYARVYLDDLIIIAEDKKKATEHYEYVINLFQKLGLPVANDKLQPPSHSVEWLGININSSTMTLSIPEKKVSETIIAVNKCKNKDIISRKKLQSIVGRLIHVAKCVPPARLFVSRLLEALRGEQHKQIQVTDEMKADLEWFALFCRGWNGVSLISPIRPSKDIYVDASLTGVGAHDGQKAYATQIGGDHQMVRNIGELEAMNVAIALHSFMDESYVGAHIRIFCDNAPSVQTLQTGKGRNKVVLQVARAIWMLQARYNISITYTHIMGKVNTLADALSRAHLSPAMRHLADTEIKKQGLTIVDPCLYIFDIIDDVIFL